MKRIVSIKPHILILKTMIDKILKSFAIIPIKYNKEYK